MAAELDRPSETRAATAQSGSPGEPAEPGAAGDPGGAGTGAGAVDTTAPIAESTTSPGPLAGPTMVEPTQLVPRRTRMVPIGTFEIPAAIRPIAAPDGWADVLTGADGPRLWDRIVL